MENKSESNDTFSKVYFWLVPFIVPVIVTFVSYLFYPFVSIDLRWVPVLLIYWGTIWALTLIYKFKRGGVFEEERFRLTLKLKGDYLWLQYLLVYGPLIYSIPLFIINYAAHLSFEMYILIIIASVINGPSEEIYWRACMEDVGINAGVSQKGRLAFAPIAFAFWHTAFVIHLFPWNEYWFFAWGGIILMTWSSGFIWMWVMHRSGRLIPQCFYHSCANFLSIFPMMLVVILPLLLRPAPLF
ncbi:MAG: CPBP family intramembrane metalloprotease [Candidatus Helarchaeota archaeon]|nr:CPBP family intramembrane metalloprotease [Candidatus Helarchaeota archaeon]